MRSQSRRDMTEPLASTAQNLETTRRRLASEDVETIDLRVACRCETSGQAAAITEEQRALILAWRCDL
ncbi:MAG: hypothetical protein LBJ67_09585 [Planctomycetaceae bacterium]|nr:hypothetical protein [Planctomycetaceae bacterium]